MPSPKSGARKSKATAKETSAKGGPGKTAKKKPDSGAPGRARGRSSAAGSIGRRAAASTAAVAEALADRTPGSLTLVVTEKPSVARDVAQALGRGGDKLKAKAGFLIGGRHVVTWAIGHLLELCEPDDYAPSLKRWRLEDLPILPDTFRTKPIAKTKAQLDVVLALLRSPVFAEVVNACDAGREGELIFRHLQEAAESALPVRRLWISAMTDEAILEGFESLGDGREYENLEAAARCRSESDWLVGINATRGMTKKCGGVLLSVGRVQTPTLAILAEREREIQAFVPVKYWEIEASFETGAGASYRGTWFGPEAKDGRLGDPVRAAAIADRVRDRAGLVTDVERRRRSQASPLLHDLTQLQRDMNRRYGFAASRTLRLAQDLYERYKVITYPRTDSRFLSGRNIPLLVPTMRAVAEVSDELAQAAAPLLAGERLPISGRQVNDARVRDHHAIIPTVKAGSAAKLKGDHRKLFEAIAERFIATFYPPAIVEDTAVTTSVAEETFRSEGRVVVERGWLAVEASPWLTGSGSAELPGLEAGDGVRTTAAEALEKETKPPPRYTEASLLQMMETAGKLLDDEELQEAMKERGIGTPATRAAIIERLIDVGYLDRDRRSLVATAKGLELISAIPTRDLVSPALTGAWEAKLRQVEAGHLSRESFMGEIGAFVTRMVDEVRSLEADGLADRMQRTIGHCPKCGAEVVEGRRAYHCARWKETGCDFYIWKVIAGRALQPLEAAKLLSDGKTPLLRGFRSRAGRRFPAFLTLTPEGVKFSFPERKAPRSDTG